MGKINTIIDTATVKFKFKKPFCKGGHIINYVVLKHNCKYYIGYECLTQPMFVKQTKYYRLASFKEFDSSEDAKAYYLSEMFDISGE